MSGVFLCRERGEGMKRIVRGAKLAGIEKPKYVYPTRKSVVTYDGGHIYIDGVDIAKIPTITGTPIQSGHINEPVIELMREE